MLIRSRNHRSTSNYFCFESIFFWSNAGHRVHTSGKSIINLFFPFLGKNQLTPSLSLFIVLGVGTVVGLVVAVAMALDDFFDWSMVMSRSSSNFLKQYCCDRTIS